MSDEVQLTEEQYEKIRGEILKWLSCQGFYLDEKDGDIFCRAQQDHNSYVIIDSNFNITQGAGSMKDKKKVAYMQSMLTVQMQRIRGGLI